MDITFHEKPQQVWEDTLRQGDIVIAKGGYSRLEGFLSEGTIGYYRGAFQQGNTLYSAKSRIVQVVDPTQLNDPPEVELVFWCKSAGHKDVVEVVGRVSDEGFRRDEYSSDPGIMPRLTKEEETEIFARVSAHESNNLHKELF